MDFLFDRCLPALADDIRLETGFADMMKLSGFSIRQEFLKSRAGMVEIGRLSG